MVLIYSPAFLATFWESRTIRCFRMAMCRSSSTVWKVKRTMEITGMSRMKAWMIMGIMDSSILGKQMGQVCKVSEMKVIGDVCLFFVDPFICCVPQRGSYYGRSHF